MIRIVLLSFAVVALAAVAGAKSYTVNLFEPAVLGGTELKAGEYKVEVIDQKAVVRNGKLHGEFPVKVETSDSRYSTTTVRFSNGDGKLHIQEIRLGGTTTKLVFSE
jgi:hypothetical protein